MGFAPQAPIFPFENGEDLPEGPRNRREKNQGYNMIQEQNSSGFLFVRRIKWRKIGSMTKYQPLYGDMPSTFIEEFGLELRVWLPPQLVTES